MMIYRNIFLLMCCVSYLNIKAQLPKVIDTTQNWQLTWSDEFDYPNKDSDKNWVSKNGPSRHILSSRWRENAVVEDNLLFLNNKKETRAGQQWTSASIWTHKRFKYGYFECRYMYAAAAATNNSFWLMSKDGNPTVGKKFEIDINEGHFPNEVNTNIHQWSDFTINEKGKKTHYSYHKSFPFGTKPGYSIQLEIPVSTSKIRLISNSKSRVNIGEFRVYGVNQGKYPDVMSTSADSDMLSLKNLAAQKDVNITTSGSFKNKNTKLNLVDGKMNSLYTTQDTGEKWIEFEWSQNIMVGCVQFLNGWRDKKGNWHNLITDYKLQYFKNGKWVDISVLDVTKDYNFGQEFHTYGLLWNEKELVFYFDGKEIRREKNEFCYSPSPIWLSLAIINWSGQVSDAIDGTSMKVDYVRYYQKFDNN